MSEQHRFERDLWVISTLAVLILAAMGWWIG